MSVTRKTVEIAKVKSQVNMMLRDSVDEVLEGRIALAILLEHILMDAGCYRGFGYQTGVVVNGNVIGDESRRIYY